MGYKKGRYINPKTGKVRLLAAGYKEAWAWTEENIDSDIEADRNLAMAHEMAVDRMCRDGDQRKLIDICGEVPKDIWFECMGALGEIQQRSFDLRDLIGRHICETRLGGVKFRKEEKHSGDEDDGPFAFLKNC